MPVSFKGHLDAEAAIAAMHRAAAAFKPAPEPPYIPPNTAVQRIAYLPVEISSREMASKAWLAGELARMGWEVIVGASWNLAAHGFADFPPGVVLFKTMNFFDGGFMYQARKHGHLVACLNEELFGIKPEVDLYEIETHPLARSLIDLACAHGQGQAEILRGLLPDRANVAVTGNPRATLRREIREYHVTRWLNECRLPSEGETLVCLMAGNTNGILPVQDYMGVTFRALNRADRKVTDFLEQAITDEVRNHGAILTRANELEAEGHTVRLRPHPVENPDLYEIQGNIILDDRTPIGERMKHAKRVVFVSGCGTGVDACLAGVPSERVGTGGHGLSSLDADAIRAEFADRCTLPEALDAYQRDRSRTGRTTATRALSMRSQGFSPTPFHRAKFRDHTPAEISHMAGGATVAQVGWNLWAVTA